jgi:hypothetical protein
VTTRYHDAASVHVDLDPDEVAERLAQPELLRGVDDRLARGPVAIRQGADRVEVTGPDGDVHLAFRLRPEGEGTRVAALEDARPTDGFDAVKRALAPGRAHQDLVDELDRLRILLEGPED